MTTTPPAIAAYIRAVLDRIPRTSPDRGRIEEDLRAHLAERVEAGDTPAAAVAAMGDPTTVAASYLGEQSLRYAPLGRRFLAAVVDFMILSMGWVVPVGLFLLLLDRQAPWWGVGAGFMAAGLWAVTSMIYFPVTEAIFGQTLGKRLFDLAVVTESGLAIGAKEAIIRRVPYLVHVAIVIDAIFVFVGQKRQRVFDHVAGTVVVQTA